MLKKTSGAVSLLLFLSVAVSAKQRHVQDRTTEELLAPLAAVIPNEPAEVTPEITGLIWQAGATKRLEAAVLLIRALAFNYNTSGSNEFRPPVGMLPAATSLHYHFGTSVLPLLMYAGVTTDQEWLRRRIALIFRELYPAAEVSKVREAFSLNTAASPAARQLKEFLDAPELKVELFNAARRDAEELVKTMLQLRHSMDIVGIEPTVLIRSMFPDAAESSEKPRAVYGTVAKRFLTSGGTVELQYAIYPDRSLAKSVLSRTMPQLVASWFQDDYSEGFVSSSAAHVRIDNMVLFLFPGIGEKPVCSPADALARLREFVERGHGIRRGGKVNTPAVKVLEVRGEDASLLGGRAKVLVEALDGGLENLLLPETGVEKRSCGGKDCVEITFERGATDSEPMLRLVRPTGEALELPLSQLAVQE